jgi:IS4 transposase
MNLGRTVFAQLVELLPRRAFELAIERHRTSGRPLALSCMDQLLCMIFAQLTGRSSLRETVTCLRAIGSRRYHLGIRHPPARSTLADANERRDHRIFMDTALSMIASARAELPVDADLRRLGVRAAFALDSTTIDLCLALFPWARFKRTKGAVKAHVLLDLHVGLPVFMRISHGKTSDISTLDQLTFLPGAFYVFDRAYVDFARLRRIDRAKAFFVTRPKRKMKFRVTRRLPADPGRGVIRDRLIRLTGQTTRTLAAGWTLRLVRYVDPSTGRRLTFLTNHLTLDAWQVALLYRKRWQIELLFKWMKQHLHIKAFFGTTSNAVKAQLWIAVITLVLIHRLKHRLGLRQTPNDIAQILSVTLCEKTPINQAFLDEVEQNATVQDRNQMMLFGL